MQLPGAVVLVTGSTQGIGRSTVALLTARGARVVGAGRTATPPDVAVDLTDPAAPAALVRTVLDRHGRLDAVVSCAGVGAAGDLAALPAEQVVALVGLDLVAPVLLARAALPAMRAAGRGALLFVSSVAGALGVPGESAYSAAKAGLETFAEVLREEVRADGITVTTVLPGVVDTGFFATRGQPYDRRFPRPVPAERAARVVVDALEHGRRRVLTPRWLAGPARLRATAPVLYRALERRLS